MRQAGFVRDRCVVSDRTVADVAHRFSDFWFGCWSWRGAGCCAIGAYDGEVAFRKRKALLFGSECGGGGGCGYKCDTLALEACAEDALIDQRDCVGIIIVVRHGGMARRSSEPNGCRVEGEVIIWELRDNLDRRNR